MNTTCGRPAARRPLLPRFFHDLRPDGLPPPACAGHPWRYSNEQITYHYSRDRSVLLKAMLRRNLGPASPQLPATGLLNPALQAFHAATMAAREREAARTLAAATPPAAAVLTPGASPQPPAVTAA